MDRRATRRGVAHQPRLGDRHPLPLAGGGAGTGELRQRVPSRLSLFSRVRESASLCRRHDPKPSRMDSRGSPVLTIPEAPLAHSAKLILSFFLAVARRLAAGRSGPVFLSMRVPMSPECARFWPADKPGAFPEALRSSSHYEQATSCHPAWFSLIFTQEGLTQLQACFISVALPCDSGPSRPQPFSG